MVVLWLMLQDGQHSPLSAPVYTHEDYYGIYSIDNACWFILELSYCGSKNRLHVCSVFRYQPIFNNNHDVITIRDKTQKSHDPLNASYKKPTSSPKFPLLFLFSLHQKSKQNYATTVVAGFSRAMSCHRPKHSFGYMVLETKIFPR